MRVQCPQCGSGGNVPDEKIPAEGRKIVCPKCKTTFLAKKSATAATQQPARDEINASYLEGVQLLKNKQVDAAIRMLTDVVRANSKHQEAYRYLGLAYGQKNLWDDAIDVLQKAVTLKPDDLLSLKNLGIALLRQNRFEEAERVLEQALQYAPEDENAQSYLNMAVRGRQKAQPAEEDDAEHALADLTRDERDDEQELATLTASSSASSSKTPYNPAQEYLNKGTEFLENGQLNKAAEMFEEAIRLAPESSDGHFGLGMVYEKRQEWKKAIDAYQKAVAINPNDLLAKETLKFLKKQRKKFRWPWQKG
ncbi:TPR repeat/tetratricopeptide TPR_3 protein [Candidatus Moduliflexus flocculans]|uniref:TPR repeat/tetratricopeptide TPR_3 protein n=1 Tax=Candidatus Moduliflexus flocculans TaxID=1499966 RepID=A0A0S6VTU9_9BACT|nr:TPR repeat/tetratricopeptide TPR_3 protein [Candidatus Moduliflexus flocculans]